MLRLQRHRSVPATTGADNQLPRPSAFVNGGVDFGRAPAT
jgi:hypothetical protein